MRLLNKRKKYHAKSGLIKSNLSLILFLTDWEDYISARFRFYF